ncbi:hypothetical protein KUCAC02_008877, partial [Chaenocephalus aceratus]
MAPGAKKGILERLDAGEIVFGDGGFVFALEKRGYVKAGPWTPEAAAEHPEAVRQLHREFLRAGSNVMQTFTFYASDDKLEEQGQYSGLLWAADKTKQHVTWPGRWPMRGMLWWQGESLKPPLTLAARKDVDFLIAEYFEHVEEAEWAVQVLKSTGKPVAATMCIGPDGDLNGVSPGDCAVKLIKLIVGINCHFDPMTCVKTVKMMKEGVEKAGLKAHYMCQPLAYHTPDCNWPGFIDLPEFPFSLEPRILTRWDMQQYAREAYNAGAGPREGSLPQGSEKHGIWAVAWRCTQSPGSELGPV